MKFIVGQGSKKREIVGPFGLCASRADFENLRDQINTWLSEPGNGCGISYGYLFVQEKIVELGGPGKPEPWE